MLASREELQAKEKINKLLFYVAAGRTTAGSSSSLAKGARTQAGHGGHAAAEAALRYSGQGRVRAGLTQCCSCQGCALWSGSSGALCTYL